MKDLGLLSKIYRPEYVQMLYAKGDITYGNVTYKNDNGTSINKVGDYYALTTESTFKVDYFCNLLADVFVYGNVKGYDP